MKREFQATFLLLNTFPSIIDGETLKSTGHFLPCGIDFKTNCQHVYSQWIWIFGMSTATRHVISMGHFHSTHPNAHFAKIGQVSHNSYVMTEFFTHPKQDFTHLGQEDGWLGRTLLGQS